jgi:hypothetical protein
MRALRWRADLKAAASRTREVGEELQPATSLPDEKILIQGKLSPSAKKVTPCHFPTAGIRHQYPDNCRFDRSVGVSSQREAEKSLSPSAAHGQIKIQAAVDSPH